MSALEVSPRRPHPSHRRKRGFDTIRIYIIFRSRGDRHIDRPKYRYDSMIANFYRLQDLPSSEMTAMEFVGLAFGMHF